MKHHDSEKDPLWDLLRESPGHRPGPRFVDDVVRAARLLPRPQPWWRRSWLPLSVGGLLAGTAAIALVVMLPQHGTQAVVTVTPPAGSFDEIQDGVETEVLIAAADHLASYSDDELVSLIGF